MYLRSFYRLIPVLVAQRDNMFKFFRMISVVMKSLFRQTACRMYPQKKPIFYELSRGHVEIDAPRCILCCLCAKKCPTHAIQVFREKREWKIDRLRCILCNECVLRCPPKCLSMPAEMMKPQTSQHLETFVIPTKAPL